MAIGSGLAAQFGFAAESTVGTAVTVTKFVEMRGETLKYDVNWLESSSIRAGQLGKRASRVAQSQFGASGDLTLEHADKGMGLLWKHSLGAALGPTQIAASTAYEAIFTPGDMTALGLTVQAGRPQTDGTVRPFTYNGCKVAGWEFSVSDGEIAQLALTLDGWNESVATALATASYPANAGNFTFADAGLFTLGGTASTTAGKTTVASGTAVATVCTGFTLTGTNPMKTDRRGLGNNGIKKNQIQNDFMTITGSLSGEFTDRTEFYDKFKAGTSHVLQLDLSHGDAGSSNPFRISLILPSIKIKSAAVNADGPDVLDSTIEFEAYDDGSGTNPLIQVRLVSTDTTL